MTRSFVGRAGHKLDHAIEAFGLELSGSVCADFGCHTGGFTDCLLQRGASRVYAIDTAYGILDYTLRIDERVVVMERSNAMHAEPPPDGPVDLVSLDVGWTPQQKALPNALRWLKPDGVILSLIKPHYEAKAMKRDELLHNGILVPEDAERVRDEVLSMVPELGVRCDGCVTSPLLGGKTRGNKTGNVEFVALLRRDD
ncbi:MAG: SAM-dependent methyltransferase [Planctomycetota bacterium]